MIESGAKDERDLCLSITSLESSSTAEMDCLVLLEKNCVDEVAEKGGVFVDRKEAYNGVKVHLKEARRLC